VETVFTRGGKSFHKRSAGSWAGGSRQGAISLLKNQVVTYTESDAVSVLADAR